jgi:copper transport protein
MRSAYRALVLLVVLAGWAIAALPVQAHARVVASFPQDGTVTSGSPAGIHLWFSEPVQPVGPGIIVLSPSGRRMVVGKLHADGTELWLPLRAEAPGTYLVIWQVISQDTHPERGRLTFSVGHTSPVPGSAGFGPISSLGLALQVIARWLHLAGFTLAFGPIAFRLFILLPLGLRGEAARRRLWRLTTLGILLLVLAEPLALLAQTASLGSGLWDADLAGEALSSSFGQVMAHRLGAAAALWLLAGVVRAGAARAEWLMLITGLALAVADGQASHAVSSGPLFVGLAAHAGHQAAMAVWVGGLVALLAVWNMTDVAPSRGQVFRAFAEIAFLCVMIIAITGLLMASIHLSGPTDLLSSAYGRALLGKTVLLVSALSLAWFGGRPGRVRRERLWRLELLGLSGILLLASLMVSVAPPA